MNPLLLSLALLAPAQPPKADPNDFGVLRKASGSSDWTMVAAGLPQVEVAGLAIVPSARKLYAATHGRSAWQLTLPYPSSIESRKGRLRAALSFP